MHHHLPAGGELRLFAGLRRELVEFLDRMPQIIPFAPRRLDFRALRIKGVARFRHASVGVARGVSLLEMPAEKIEQSAMRGRIDQRAVVMLAVQLHQPGSHGAQGLRADRLIVDAGARPPVGELNALENEVAVDEDVMRRRRQPRGMIRRKIERGDDLPLRLPLPHEAAVAARPERKRQGVEKDGFPGAGFAGEHGKPAIEIQIEAIDQHDVANRELDQHRARSRRKAS